MFFFMKFDGIMRLFFNVIKTATNKLFSHFIIQFFTYL